MVAHELVAEAAVVGVPTTPPAKPWWLRGAQARAPEGEEAQAIAKQLRDWVAKEIGPIAKPKDIRFGDNLPKTRSGKIMRRLLRVVAKGEEITRTCPRWKTPPSWINWPSRCRSDAFRSRPPPVRIVDETAGGHGPRRAGSIMADARNGIRYGRLPIPIHLESPQ